MIFGVLISVFLLAGDNNVDCWTDYFDVDFLCDPDDIMGDLCDDGYGVCGGTLIKNPWTGECALTCGPGKPCYPLPHIPNGGAALLDDENNGLGALALVTCNPGYNLSGNAYLTCGADQHWYPDADELCQPIECDVDAVPGLPNGHMVVLVNQVPGYAVGSCDMGYSPSIEVITSRCNSNGEWSPVIGSCVKKYCNASELPPNLIPQGDNSVGTTAKLICEEGEVLEGCDYVVCTPDLMWTTEIGQCVPECCTAPCIKNGYVVVDGLTGVVYCNEGYHLIDSTMQIQCNPDNDTWSNLDLCEPNECSATLPTIPYSMSYLVSGNLEPGAVVNHECNIGYNSSIMRTLNSICQADGTWSTESGSCEKIYCDDSTRPSIANGGFVNQGDGSYNTESQLVCDPEYRLAGLGKIYCNINGKWDLSDATCQPECCPIPCIENGKIEPDPTDSSIGILTCDTDYVFNSNKGLECNTTTGVWNNGDLTDICIQVPS